MVIQTVLMVRDENNLEVVETRFAVPTVDFDLRKAFSNAALEYCLTEEGKDILVENEGFTFKDFFDSIPDELCAKHGFTRIDSIKSEAVFATDYVVDRWDKGCYIQYSNIGIYEKCLINYTVVEFGRMWGVMETLNPEKIPLNSNFRMYKKCIFAWAEEYVLTQQSDMHAFFEQKLEKLKKHK